MANFDLMFVSGYHSKYFVSKLHLCFERTNLRANVQLTICLVNFEYAHVRTNVQWIILLYSTVSNLSVLNTLLKRVFSIQFNFWQSYHCQHKGHILEGYEDNWVFWITNIVNSHNNESRNSWISQKSGSKIMTKFHTYIYL